MGPSLGLGTEMGPELGSRMIAYMFEVLGFYREVLGWSWFLALMVFVLAVEIALAVWSRIKGI